ncbi:cytochrome c [Candidimonas humi]|uniref:C-type cytochrome n=1 Tax=Candidimonas humi TaxID=683355 RepID=A0ABV8NU32_9BURK|nr:cytochrome c [Candidimonas humi]MBV6303755.1 cytochrome c [Candidimonas humi]
MNSKRPKAAWALGAVIVVGLVAAAGYAWQPAIAPLARAPIPEANLTLVMHGAQVAELGDCMQCHTARNGKPYAGGLPLATPFGTIYSTNITPDVKTGIGGWSREAFARAMRKGVSRDGHLLYPAFPYPHFTRMSDEDIDALYAYLMARTPVDAPARVNELSFPLNFRPLVAGWNLLFLDQGPLPQPAQPQSDAWLRGRYLVEGAGHCAACHTPMNALGAEKSSQPYAGGLVDGWDVPPLDALTSARKPWTEEQLVSYLRTGIASEHSASAGPMLPVTHHLSRVPESDIRAIASYLMSLQPPVAARPAAQAERAPAPPDAQVLAAGAAIFNASCAGCHGAAAPMRTLGQRPALEWGSTLNSDRSRNAIQMVLRGNPWNGSSAAHYMPPFADVLTDRQIADVLSYVRFTYAQRPAWSDLPASVAAIRKENSQ